MTPAYTCIEQGLGADFTWKGQRHRKGNPSPREEAEGRDGVWFLSSADQTHRDPAWEVGVPGADTPAECVTYAKAKAAL